MILLRGGGNMKEFSRWDDSEVKKLFDTIIKIKNANRSLLEGFREYARKTKRKANSVRNYYYLEVSDLKNDPERAKRLGIDIAEHTVQNPIKFSNNETEKLVTEILRLKCLGFSVRKACLKLADNDVEQMLRCQNKFRSVMNTDKTLYNKCLQNLKKNGLSENKYVQQKIDKLSKDKNKEGKIVYMKRPEVKRLTDEDVNSLFLGLVKLVKKSAIENLEKDLISETEFANSTLRNTLVKLTNAEKELEDKKRELDKAERKNKVIAEENLDLKTKMATLMSDKIIKGNKGKTLAKYLKEIKDRGIEVKTKI
jgi:hypothetical protein